MTTQTTHPTATLYDVLDVDPTSSPEQVRAAWRAAVAELDPTDRRFRVYNQAAEVLLDPARRAAYDADLAVEAEAAAGADTEVAAQADEPADPTGAVEAVEPVGDAGVSDRTHPRVPGWLLVTVAGVTAVLLGFVGVCLATPSGASVQSDTDAAQAAAEQAIVPILSYDAHALDRSEAAATAAMTSSEQEQYRRLFAVIRQNAPRTETVVRAQYVASGVVRTGTDQVDVLVFVNQRTTNRTHPTVPVVYKSQVTVTMVRVGGQWLVDGLHTNSDGS
jgi:Mce-associated membrane protein